MWRNHPQQVVSKICFVSKQKPEKKKITNTYKYVFAFIQIVFSLDFGFFKFKSLKTRIFVKSICAFQALFISFWISYFFSFTLEDPVFVLWYCSYVVEQSSLAIGLIFKNKSTFCDFCKDLFFIDSELGVEESCKPDYIVMIWTGSSITYRSTLTIIYCTCLKDYCIPVPSVLVLFHIPLVCGDVFLIVGFTIYYSLYCRIKVFADLVKDSDSDVVVFHGIYKSIVDVADRIRTSYNSLYVLSLFAHTTDMMISVFYPLIGMDTNEKEVSVIITTNALVLQTFMMVFSPAFAAGMLSSQVEKLKIVLHHRLLQERDQKHSRDIKRLLSYIEVRNLKTTIWKVIPMDWHLPVIFLNLSVTYLIVMLQFTHKY